MLMAQHQFGGIIRLDKNDSYHYIPKHGYENKPVVCVTWNSAIRYINWLHYNARKLEIGDENYEPITEGNSEIGAYNTIDFGTDMAIHSCITRNIDALYWLPNIDECRSSL